MASDIGQIMQAVAPTSGSGNDWLYAGSGGTTTIYGGSGNEVIHGGSGTNYLNGGSGLDEIYGGSGTNYIYGNGAHDLLQGGTGANYIDPRGGSGLASIEVKNDENQPTFDGTIDAEGDSYSGDCRAVGDPGYGGAVADWDFDNLGGMKRGHH